MLFDIHIPSVLAIGGYQTYHGDHDMTNCGPPDSTSRVVQENGGFDRTLTTIGSPPNTQTIQNDVIYWCAPQNDPSRAHFMTSVMTTGYDIISFAPINPVTNTPVFPASMKTICWDQNLTDQGRKWTNVSVISESKYSANHDLSFISLDFEPNRGEPGDPNNPPARLLSGDDFMYSGFGAGVSFMVGRTETFFDNYANKYFNNDVVNRFQTCLRDIGPNAQGVNQIQRSQVRGVYNSSGTLTNVVVNVVTGKGKFPAGPKVVIIHDDTYDPFKSDPVPVHVTWHWDEFDLS